MTRPLPLYIYRLATYVLWPLVMAYVAFRTRRGKEDPQRRGERFGRVSRPRPEGHLIWLHAASVGEALSILPVIESLKERQPDLHILVTTGTVTSTALLEKQASTSFFHQYIPLDLPHAVRRFLDHWRPDMIGWVESEFWPNLLGEIHRRRIPTALINARLSEKSYRQWKAWPASAAYLLSTFTLCLAQTPEYAQRLSDLGAADVRVAGNLKYAAAPLPVEAAALHALQPLCQDRPVWLMASTHTGDEDIAADAHMALAKEYPRLLTIIVPRHPLRGPDIEKVLSKRGIPLTRRSQNAALPAGAGIYIADTLGELGLFYRLAPIVCMGKSFLPPGGGQNPIEPARLGCAVIVGPRMDNFTETISALNRRGGVRICPAPEDLPRVLKELFENAGHRQHMSTAAQAFLAEHAHTARQTADVLLGFRT